MTGQTMEALESRRLLSGEPWAGPLKQMSLDLARQDFPQYTGAGQTIALVDEGIDYMHPVLGGGIGPGFKVVAGWDFSDQDASPMPGDNTDSHGTGTGGIAAGLPYVFNGEYHEGVASSANLIALRTDGASDNVKLALDWVVKHAKDYNITVVNFVGHRAKLFASDLAALQQDGIFVTTPSGNEGKKGTPATEFGSGTVSVGAINVLNQVTNYTQLGPAVDLVAPAQQVIVPWLVNGQHTFLPSDGTSWASAAVAGAAALIHQVTPAFTPDKILGILQESGNIVRVGTRHGGTVYKSLNVDAALKLAVAEARAMRARRRARAVAAASSQASPQAVRGNVFSSRVLGDENGAADDDRPVWELGVGA